MDLRAAPISGGLIIFRVWIFMLPDMKSKASRVLGDSLCHGVLTAWWGCKPCRDPRPSGAGHKENCLETREPRSGANVGPIRAVGWLKGVSEWTKVRFQGTHSLRSGVTRAESKKPYGVQVEIRAGETTGQAQGGVQGPACQWDSTRSTCGNKSALSAQ